MSINAQGFYQNKRGQYGMQSSNTRFKNDYIIAVNRSLTDAYGAVNLASQPTALTDTETDIDLDSNYAPALSASVDFYLVLFGHKSGDMNIATARELRREGWDSARLLRDLVLAESAISDDEGDSDMIANIAQDS